MDRSNDTVVVAGLDPEPAALLWQELLFHHGYGALEYALLYVSPILSNVIFIMYTMYHFRRVAPQKSSGVIDPQKRALSIRIAAFEFAFLAAQAINTGLNIDCFVLVNHVMGFVAAVTGFIIFDKESREGYSHSKSAYFFVLLWILVDVHKFSGYLSNRNTRFLAGGGYVTGYYRSELLTAMLMPSFEPGPDTATLLRQLEAKYGQMVPQPGSERCPEAASKDAPQEGTDEAIVDLLKAWKNTPRSSVPAPGKSQRRKKKHPRNMRHKAR